MKVDARADRRRLIKGVGAGVALAWTAPIITGMNARAFAAGCEPGGGSRLDRLQTRYWIGVGPRGGPTPIQ